VSLLDGQPIIMLLQQMSFVFSDLKVTITQVCSAFQLDFSEVLALLKEKYLPFGNTNFGSFSEVSLKICCE